MANLMSADLSEELVLLPLPLQVIIQRGNPFNVGHGDDRIGFHLQIDRCAIIQTRHPSIRHPDAGSFLSSQPLQRGTIYHVARV